jgi:hypothetical protein
VEREIDSLETIGFNTSLAHSLEMEKINFELLSKNPIDPKLTELQDELNIARKSLLFANKFLPRSQDFKTRVEQLDVRELGQAKEAVDKALKEMTAIQLRINKNKTRIKSLVATCEKSDKTLKSAIQELERINAVINNMKK